LPQGRGGHAQQAQLVGGGAHFRVRNIGLALAALKFGGGDDIGGVKLLRAFGIAAVQLILRPRPQIGQLLR
jgi:hypothetical protein